MPPPSPRRSLLSNHPGFFPTTMAGLQSLFLFFEHMPTTTDQTRDEDTRREDASNPEPLFLKNLRCLNAGPRSRPTTSREDHHASVQSCPFVCGDHGKPIGLLGVGIVGACTRRGPKSGDPLTRNLNHRKLGSFDQKRASYRRTPSGVRQEEYND